MKKTLFGRIWGSLLDYLISSGAVVVGGLFISVVLVGIFSKFLEGLSDSWRVNSASLLYALAYAIPLYVVHFERDAELKRSVLAGSEDGFHISSLIRDFTKDRGITDICVYAVYIALLLLPAALDIQFPSAFLAVQAAFFVELPIPWICGILLSVVLFALQYYACFIIAAHGWYKKRLHK
ncbi:MAG: hypothetical protein IJ519_03765 [Clostridia bacterium]|nr:hypothetical protein [Clostridia bacterium]